ncbi:hypothetical protein AZ18_0113 [Bordetella bronchiseptica D993]|nr:hypothetical protein AZ18_0113 [Bordetella bronchiseptica D993]KDB96303.1 hypothetical protein AZ23_0157 [Bordetella bronchiseptica E010]KDD21615.1 hypothetical protein L525_0161 [Bordetella bronchiseptica MBORD782]KDD35936.1 hypothetical protein L527_0089 [Bordetella bronchiseptica MBORD839]
MAGRNGVDGLLHGLLLSQVHDRSAMPAGRGPWNAPFRAQEDSPVAGVAIGGNGREEISTSGGYGPWLDRQHLPTRELCRHIGESM